MFKVLIDGCDPTKGTKYSACVDLYASEDVTIGAGETKLVGLGVAIAISDTYKHDDFLKSHYLQLMLRSSLSKELIIANGVGVVDLDYKDEIKIRLHNPIKNGTGVTAYVQQGDEDTNCINFHGLEYEIKKGDKIAQITLLEHKAYLFGIKSDVERDGGFGSTDEKKD